MRSQFIPILFSVLIACRGAGNNPQPTEQPKTFSIGDSKIVNSVQFSPDGKFLICGGENKHTKIIEFATGNVIWVSDIMPDAVLVNGFSPDGNRFFITTSDNTQSTGSIGMYSFTDRNRQWFIDKQTNDIQLARYSPDGRELIVGNFFNILFLDVETGKQTKFFSGHPIEVPSPYGHYDAVTDIIFTSDPNVFVSVSWDKKILIWDMKAGHDVRTYAEGDPINAMLLFPEGNRILTGSVDAITVWNRTNDAHEQTVVYDGEIKKMCWLEGGNYFVTGDGDGDLTLWKTNGLERLKDIRKAQERGIWSMSASPDGKAVVTGGGTGIVTWWPLEYLIQYNAGNADSIKIK